LLLGSAAVDLLVRQSWWEIISTILKFLWPYTLFVKLIRRSALRGFAGTQVLLGHIYDRGLGVSPDYAQALSWFQKAADQGDSEAQFRPGLMYKTSRCVAQDNPLTAAGIGAATIAGAAAYYDSVGNLDGSFGFDVGDWQIDVDLGLNQDEVDGSDDFHFQINVTYPL
jgi:TPR repeat protein